MLKCMHLDQYTQKWLQELHKTDGISQVRSEGALIPVTYQHCFVNIAPPYSGSWKITFLFFSSFP